MGKTFETIFVNLKDEINHIFMQAIIFIFQSICTISKGAIY